MQCPQYTRYNAKNIHSAMLRQEASPSHTNYLTSHPNVERSSLFALRYHNFGTSTPHWMDVHPTMLRKWNGGVDGVPCRPCLGGSRRESGRGTNVQNSKICCRSSGTGLRSFDGKQDCRTCQIRKLYRVDGGRGNGCSGSGSECQCPISTAREFLRCAKMG